MRLPLSAWKNTLRRLGFRIVLRKPQPSHAKTRTAHLEVLERREVMTASIDDIDLLNDTGTSSSDNITTDPELTITVGGDFWEGTAEVEFDHDSDGEREAYVPFYMPDDTQYYDPRNTDPSLATYVGQVTLRYRVVEYDGSHEVVGSSSWQPFTFTLEAPPEPEIVVLDPLGISIADGVGLFGFGSTQIGSPVTKTITIQNTGETELTIDTYSLEVPWGFSIVEYPSDTVAPDDETTFVIQLDAAEPGAYFGELSFSTNDEDESIYNFDLSGQVLDLDPEIEVRLASGAEVSHENYLDWGQTGVGVPVELTLTIINEGNGALVLDPEGIALSLGFTVVTPCAETVAPNGGQTTLTIQLDATQAGSYLGFLQIPNNDPDEGPFTLAVSGLVGGTSYAGQEITFSGVDLMNDTGASDSDWITYDPRLTGVVEGDFGTGSVLVQLDHNDDGLIDGSLAIASSGTTFHYNPIAVDPALAGFFGPVPLRYRAVLLDAANNPESVSQWFDLPLELVAAPSVGNLSFGDFGLVADTGVSDTDRITIWPAVYVVVDGDLEGGSARVDFDHDGDGVVEGSLAITSTTEEFTYDPRTIAPTYATAVGNYALTYRLVKLDSAGQVVATGGWDVLAFQIEAIPASQWTVAGFGLLNDTGANSSDRVTSDPTLKGLATGPGSEPNPLGLPRARVQLDLDNNGTVDDSLATDADGNFTYLPLVDNYGPRTIQARVQEWNAPYQTYLLGPWTAVTIDIVAAAAPDVEDLRLVNDTGADDDDLHTSDPTLAGQVAGGVGLLQIEYDVNGDGNVDGTTLANEEGNFQFLPMGLVGEEQEIRVRAARYDSILDETVPGDWESFEFFYESQPLPTVTELDLVITTGTSGGLDVTNRPVFSGRLTGEGTLSGVEIQLDHDLDGDVDGYATTGDEGRFEYRAFGLPAGNVTIKARPLVWDENAGQWVTGGWTAYAFVYAPTVFQAASVSSLVLAHDTGTNTTDGVTTDATLSGAVTAGTGGQSKSYLTLEFDHDGDNDVDGTTVTDAEGKFAYVPIGLVPGTYTLRARASDWDYVTRQVQPGAWATLTFTLQAETNAVPVMDSLALRADTGTSATDGITANALLVGHVSNDQSGQPLLIEFDHNGDGLAEGAAYTSASGDFHYQPAALAFGSVTIAARAVEWNPLTGQFQASGWQSLAFTYQSQPDQAPALASFGLAQPVTTGSSTTYSPEIAGTIRNEVSLTGITIEVDFNNDNTPDQVAATDVLGNFHLLANVAPGTHTARLRTREVAAGTGQLLYGAWTSLSFTYEQPPNAAPSVATLVLKNITGATSPTPSSIDPTLTGTVANDNSLAGLLVQFDYNGDDVIDATAPVSDAGTFEFSPSGLSFATHTVRARVKELDAQGVAQFGSWQSIQFVLLDPALASIRIDALTLANDTGNSSTDGATADGTVSGHVANSTTSGTVVEFDTTGDGLPDSTATTNGTGSFTFAPTGLTSGLVTVRARVKAAEGAPAAQWTSLSFVYHTSPDGTEAQALATAYGSFASQWQAARSQYASAIATADQIVRQQTQTAEDTYNTTISTAASQRASQIAAAQAAYNAILSSAEAARASALAAASSQFATNLASFAGDTTSFVLKQFVWPDAPPTNSLNSFASENQPTPPAAPTYQGASYAWESDGQYQYDTFMAEQNYQDARRQADETYRNAETQANNIFKLAQAAAWATWGVDQAATWLAYLGALAAGTNPIDLAAATATIKAQKAQLTGEYERANERALQDYAEAMAPLLPQLNADRAAALVTYNDGLAALSAQYAGQSPLPQAYYQAFASLVRSYRNATSTLDKAYTDTVADLQRDHTDGNAVRTFEWLQAMANKDNELAGIAAEHARWEEERKINARLVLDTGTAADQKKFDVAMAEANRVKTSALAAAASVREVAYATAEVNLWKAKIDAKATAVANWDAQVQTPWSEYQKKLAANEAAYAETIDDKLIDQAEDDAASALTEVQTIAAKRKILQEGAAELRRVRKVADATSWHDFRIAANNEVKDEKVKAALRTTQHGNALAAAEKQFALDYSAAICASTHSGAQSLKQWDDDDAEAQYQSTVQQNSSIYTAAQPGLSRDMEHRYAAYMKTYDLAMVTARETRGLALSLAENNNTVNSGLDKEGREHRLTDAFAAYQVAAADHAKTFATGYAAKYATFVEAVAAADADASKAFAAHEKTLADADAPAQKTWNDSDTTALKEFYVEVAQKFKDVMVSWAAAWNNPYTAMFVQLAQVELTRVTSLGTALVTHATTAGSQLVTFLQGLTTKSKTLADDVATGLEGQTNTLAGALQGYAGDVATARHAYALALAEKTALHDKGVASRNHIYKVDQANREQIYRNDYDAAQWTFERAQAQRNYDLRIDIGDVYVEHAQSEWYSYQAPLAVQLNMPTAAMNLTRRNARAQAERNKTVGLAEKHALWVNDIGVIHVALAGNAKAAADALAGSLKSASDGLTADQAGAANDLAGALAGAEKEYASGTATEQAGNDKELAKVDGKLSMDLTDVANAEREGKGDARGDYEVALYEAHADKLEQGIAAATLVGGGGIWAGGTSQTTDDLLVFQSLAAAADAVWAAGAAAAKAAYEGLLSAAYAGLAADEYGPTGAVTTHASTAADTTADQESGMAVAEKDRTVTKIGNLASFGASLDFVESNVTKLAVEARSQYEVSWVSAQRDYNHSVTVADLARITAVADAELAFTIASPLDGNPWPPGAQATATAIRDALIAQANDAYSAAAKDAKETYVGQIGVARIVYAVSMRNALIEEASDSSAAQVTYVTAQNAAEWAFAQAVTAFTESGAAAIAGAAMTYAIAAAGNSVSLVAGLGTALVGLAQAMKPVNVTHATSYAAAEGPYQVSLADEAADQALIVAAGAPLSSQQTFTAAEATAKAAWISGMVGPFVSFASALATAHADEVIALTQAAVGLDNARAQADLARTTAVEAVYFNHQVRTRAAERDYAESDVQRLGTQRLTDAQAAMLSDVALAEATGDRVVAYAEAEAAFLVAQAGLDVGQSDAALAHARDVAKADADVAYVTAHADAHLLYLLGKPAIPPSPEDPDGEPAVIGIVAGGCTEQQERATAWRDLQVALADIMRDTVIDCIPHEQTRANAYASAMASYWSACVAAASARQTADSLAIANYRTADYAQFAAAIAGIHTTMQLPWTEYQADLVAAESTWWVNYDRSNYLGLTSAVNAAETAYQTTVGAAYLAWASATSLAERDWATASANMMFDRAERDLDADRDYQHTIALAEENWQIDHATTQRTYDIASATNQREFVSTGNASARDSANLVALSTYSQAVRNEEQLFTISEVGAAGVRATIRAGSSCTEIDDENLASGAYAASTASASQTFAIAESNAAYARTASIAQAQSAHDVTQADTYSDALDALDLASSTPWSEYDAALAAADGVFTQAVAPATRDLIIEAADAERDYEIAQATAQSILALALEARRAEHRDSAATAKQARVVDEVFAQNEAADLLPLSHFTSLDSDSTDLELSFASLAKGPEKRREPPLEIPPSTNQGKAATVFTSTPAGDAIPQSPEELFDMLRKGINEQMPSLDSGLGKWRTGSDPYDPLIEDPKLRNNGFFHLKGRLASEGPIEYKNARPTFKSIDGIEVDILPTGTSGGDLKRALEEAENTFGRRVRDMILSKKAVFHHKEFDPTTGRFKMQLVDLSVHNIAKHAGAFADYLAYIAAMMYDRAAYLAAPEHLRKAFAVTVDNSVLLRRVYSKIAKGLGSEVLELTAKTVNGVTEYRVLFKASTGEVVTVILKSAGSFLVAWTVLSAFSSAYGQTHDPKEAVLAAWKAGLKDVTNLDLFELVVYNGSELVEQQLIRPRQHWEKRLRRGYWEEAFIKAQGEQLDEWKRQYPAPFSRYYKIDWFGKGE